MSAEYDGSVPIDRFMKERISFFEIALLEDTHAQELLLRFADGAKVYDQVGNVVRIRANGDADLIR